MDEVAVYCELQLERAAGAGTFRVPFHESISLQGLMNELCQQAKPELKVLLLSETSELNPGILVFVNERMVPRELQSETQLRNGDIVLLYPAISGG